MIGAAADQIHRNAGLLEPPPRDDQPAKTNVGADTDSKTTMNGANERASAATHVQSGLGGLRLERGMEFDIGEAGTSLPRRLLEHAYSPLYNGATKVIRVVDGPHASHFPPEAMSLFTGTVYRVTDQSSRTAIRLEGLALPAPTEPLVSAGAWHGAIQVPPSGLPQVLAADHPATGGYPILASVIRADLEALGQLRPREEIRFGRVSLETARALLKRLAESWATIAP